MVLFQRLVLDLFSERVTIFVTVNNALTKIEFQVTVGPKGS